MYEISYNRKGKILTFKKEEPQFTVIVDCSKPLTVVREINPGSCTAEEIRENLEELTSFLKSREFKALKNPE